MTTTENTLDPARKIRALWANPQMRYPVLMIAYLIAGASLFTIDLSEYPNAVGNLERFTAVVIHKFLGLFTNLTTQRDGIVTLDGFSVLVITECVGIFEMVIYSACVLAFPAPLRAKFWGIPLGCAAIFGFNILRIATLLVIGRHWNEYFDFFHIYFWQATLIAMIVGVLYGWIKLFVHR
jgi:archaeosortase B (VPXXXP-CTERM-specific)